MSSTVPAVPANSGSSSVVVRAVAQKDREVWGELFAAYGVFYETAFDEATINGVWNWLMDDQHEVSAIVAESDGNVIGFANYRRVADTFTAASSWNLDDLYVSPRARGAGAATALIDGVAAIARAAGGGTVRWITADDNLTAQRVYDKVATRAGWVTYELEVE
jgi:ribosomal protein S18 acetylase RimI-like enzyme